MNDFEVMQIAYGEARIAYDRGEYPVGAVLVSGGQIIVQAGNRCVIDTDPTAHAEILAIRQGYKLLGGRSMKDCTLFTTMFPCPMCEKTIVEVGIGRVVYGATPFKWIREHKYVKLVPTYNGPIMQTECRELFQMRLQQNGREDILSYEKSHFG